MKHTLNYSTHGQSTLPDFWDDLTEMQKKEVEQIVHQAIADFFGQYPPISLVDDQCSWTADRQLADHKPLSEVRKTFNLAKYERALKAQLLEETTRSQTIDGVVQPKTQADFESLHAKVRDAVARHFREYLKYKEEISV